MMRVPAQTIKKTTDHSQEERTVDGLKNDERDDQKYSLSFHTRTDVGR
jgi:hypothetical protein